MIQVDKLIWTEQNKDHIAIHNVSQAEVEEVCHNNPVFVSAYSGRVMGIGKTNACRAVTVILQSEKESGVWYVVTARSADRKERKFYFTMKGEVL